MSNWTGILGAVVMGLVINEFSELSPWLARRLVRWAAGVRYPDRVEELEAVLDARPGKLFKLVTAFGFVFTAVAYRVTHRHAARGPFAWERRYRRSVVIADVLCTVAAVVSTGAVLSAKQVSFAPSPLIVVEAVTVAAVLGSLYLNRAWTTMALGRGVEDVRSLARGLVVAIVVMGLGALATGLSSARLWVVVVGPVIVLTTVQVRSLMRRVLWRARGEGRCLRSILVAGTANTAQDLINRTGRAPHLGWRVDAVCTVDGRVGADVDLDGIPVVGRFDQMADLVRRGGYGIVVIAPDVHWTPRRLQHLVWALRDTDTKVIVEPTLMDFVGGRLQTTGVLGMPLLWVSEPSFTGIRRVVKSTTDKVVALLLLALLSPVLVAVAVAIKSGGGGPVLCRQRRVGKDGVPFTMLTFRTLVADTDGARSPSEPPAAGALPEPRVTRVGALLRQYSLDELPQLVTVLTGSMSLVGPRPPLLEECLGHHSTTRSQLPVKPGLTGLWQISGRSDLSWDEAARLDLRYVEDWSFALDVLILWRTFRAVFVDQSNA